MRLPMKPSHTPDTTAVFLIFLAIAITVASTRLLLAAAETVAIAAQLMRSANISALVVKDVVRTEGNTAAGMFTERDVVRAIAEHGAAGLKEAIDTLCARAEAAVREGINIIILSDRRAGAEAIPIPSLLACAAEAGFATLDTFDGLAAAVRAKGVDSIFRSSHPGPQGARLNAEAMDHAGITIKERNA